MIRDDDSSKFSEVEEEVNEQTQKRERKIEKRSYGSLFCSVDDTESFPFPSCCGNRDVLSYQNFPKHEI